MQTYPRNLKSLALLAVLVLCLFAFTLVSTGEAQAQERLWQTPQRPMAEGEAERSEILDGKGADQVALQPSPVETASVESTMSEASPPGQSLSSPVGSTPPASKSEPAPQQYAVVIRDGEKVESDPDLVPAPQKAQPAPASRLSDQPSLGKQAEAETKKPVPTPGSAAQEPYSGSSETGAAGVPVSEHVPPVPSLSEGEGVPVGTPTPSPFEEDPDAGIAPLSPSALIEPVEQQETPSAADLVAAPASSRTPDQATLPPAQQGAQQPLPISSSVETASSGVAQDALTQSLTTVADAAASALATLGSWTDYSPSGETTETPLEGATPAPLAPQVPSPFEGSSVFSSYSGVSGQTGPWGGFIVLLLGVLVSGLVLLLWEGFLSWVVWEQPKPSSALLLPLERPG